MKVLITGATGQAGQAISEVVQSHGHELITLSHNDLDITSRNDVFVCLNSMMPDAVINAAAMTNVDACEKEYDKAFTINALGVRNLTQASESISAHLLHISSDFVFDGDIDRQYSEFDIPNPLSVYGKSKLAGDNEALRYGNSSVLRVAWVFGDPKKDFFTWVQNGVQEGSLTSLVDDQVGTPTYSYDLADVVLDCITNRIYGLINVVNTDETTRLEMAQVFCNKVGIDVALEPIKASELSRPAPRPAYSALSTTLLTQLTGRNMRSWLDALADRIIRSK